eukprot:6201055-Pleurochrysis_carterae.AAC.5
MRAIQSGKLLTEKKCTAKCTYGHTCMQITFTINQLRKCAARAFGERVLKGEAPSIKFHMATKKWFKLIFACRVVVANKVTEINYNIDGRGVCKGAFQAAYGIPSATIDDIVRRVFAGHHAWVTYEYAMTATANFAATNFVLSELLQHGG